jgi:cellulose synthase/poly-beta-1,6-N-acetylglucosamine synthase-like glycosyltransferase
MSTDGHLAVENRVDLSAGANDSPACSVCIANYNGINLIGPCLDSVLAQDFSLPVEIIVHDDASSDESVSFIREHYPDPTAAKGEPWVAVTTAAVEPLPKAVTLAAIKAEPKLKGMALVKYSRLSVQPVTAEEWKLICKMGGVKA